MLPVPDHAAGTPFGARGPRWSCSRDVNGDGIHTGVDFPAPVGTPVVAARPGIVAWDDHGPLFGSHQLEIRCDDGTRDFYAHMSARLAAPATRVTAGQVIGRVGEEGNAFGPHLHFERHSVAFGPWGCSIIRDPQLSLDWTDPMEDDMPAPKDWDEDDWAEVERRLPGMIWRFVVRPARKATATEAAVTEQTAQAAIKKAANG